MCNTGVGLTPLVDQKTYHFGVVGAANGLSIMMDEETRSLWDPLTGKAFRGPMDGTGLQIWPVFYTTAGKEAADFDGTQIFISKNRNPMKWIFQRIFRPLLGLDSRGFIPPYFFGTMSAPIDARLPKLEQGLGVIAGRKAKYYPLKLIKPGSEINDPWEVDTIVIQRPADGGMPEARWSSGSEMPMQILSRWYGFAFTYPDCEIYQAASE